MELLVIVFHYAWFCMSGGYGAGEADQENDGGGYDKQE